MDVVLNVIVIVFMIVDVMSVLANEQRERKKTIRNAPSTMSSKSDSDDESASRTIVRTTLRTRKYIFIFNNKNGK